MFLENSFENEKFKKIKSQTFILGMQDVLLLPTSEKLRKYIWCIWISTAILFQLPRFVGPILEGKLKRKIPETLRGGPQYSLSLSVYQFRLFFQQNGNKNISFQDLNTQRGVIFLNFWIKLAIIDKPWHVIYQFSVLFLKLNNGYNKNPFETLHYVGKFGPGYWISPI